MYNYFFFGVAVGTVAFALHTQYSPSMGGVWYRSGKFTPFGLLKLMLYPFHTMAAWNPKLWDINWPIVASLFGGLFHYLGKLKKNIVLLKLVVLISFYCPFEFRQKCLGK